MLNSLFRWILLAFSLILVAKIVPGMEIAGFFAALVAVVAIALVNMFVKPLAMFLTLPINILTFGLFTVVVNAALLALAALFVPGFSIGGFFPAFLGSVLYSIMSLIVNMASGQLKPA